jgi:hypothetical protein
MGTPLQTVKKRRCTLGKYQTRKASQKSCNKNGGVNYSAVCSAVVENKIQTVSDHTNNPPGTFAKGNLKFPLTLGSTVLFA